MYTNLYAPVDGQDDDDDDNENEDIAAGGSHEFLGNVE